MKVLNVDSTMFIKTTSYYLLVSLIFLLCSNSIRSQATRTYQSSASIRQVIDVQQHIGKQFRLSAAAKVFLEDENFSEAKLFVGVFGATGRRISFFSLDGDSITAREWRHYTLTGAIPQGAENIRAGVIVMGNGKFLVDDFKLEVKERNGVWEEIVLNNQGFENGLGEGELPASWTGTIERVHDFEGTIIDSTSAEGEFAYLITGAGIPIPATLVPETSPKPWTGFEQRMDISSHLGQRFKLSAKVKVEQSSQNGRANLYVRVSNTNGQIVFFNNMRDRPITTSDWQSYEIEGTFGKGSHRIAIGGLTTLGGKSYFDDFQLSVLNKDQKWEILPLINASFEQAKLVDEGPKGWQWAGGENARFKTDFHNEESPEGQHSLVILGTEPSNPFHVPSVPISVVDSLQLLQRGRAWDYIYPNPNISLRNKLLSIAEDAKGFIWLASYEGGLIKYDGTQFRYYYFNSAETGARCNVQEIFPVQERALWLVTSCGLMLFDLTKEEFYLQESLQTALPPGEITRISKGLEDDIWITIQDEGAFRYFPSKDSVARFSTRPFLNSASIVESSIGYQNPINQNQLRYTDHFRLMDYIYDRTSHTIAPLPYNFLSSAGSSFASIDSMVFWIGSSWGRGLSLYDFEKGLFSNYRAKGFISAKIGGEYLGYESYNIPPYINPGLNLSSDYIYSLLYTTDKRLLVGTEKGLNVFLPEQNSFFQIEHQSAHPQANSGNIITDLLEDKTGNVWVATEAGLRVQWRHKNSFNYFEIPLTEATPGEVEQQIDGMVEWDEEHVLLWNSSEMYLYNIERKSVKALRSNASIFQFLKDYPIVYVEKMQDGMLWIGTYYIVAPGNYSLFRYDPKTDQVLGEYHYTGRSDGMSKYQTTSVVQQDSNIVWIATIDGLNKLDLRTQQFQHYRYSPVDINSLSSNILNAVYLDRANNLWVATDGAGLNLYVEEIDGFQRFVYESGKEGTLSSNTVFDIREDDKNRLWIATDNGLNHYDRENESFLHYQRSHQEADNTYYFLFDDRNGNLWSATKEELVRFNSDSLSFTFFNEKDGIASPINSYSGFEDQRGNLYFGGLTGLIFFAPEEINQTNPDMPTLAITEFILGDQVITPANAEGILDRHISYTNSIALKHWQNEFTFKFVALDLANPGQNQYRVMLDGADRQWRELGNKTEVTYSNLSPGRYTFRVKGSNNDGVWNEEGIELAIRIRPPWYWAWWSKSLYMLSIGGIIYVFYITQLKQQLEKAEADRLRELDEVKTRLYANITHEFRTPLTIILGMAEQAVKNPKDWLVEGSRMIKRNGNRLLYLVNQMLDLSKLESGSMPLNLVNADIIQYLRYINESFHSYAEIKGVSLHFLTSVYSYSMDFDPAKLLDIVSNLVSNAVKYSPEGSNVYMHVQMVQDSDESFLEIKVADAGSGIKEEELDKIFERFYQTDQGNIQQAEGTGIGLALTKELVKLLDGKITATSQIGKGSTFTVLLPARQAAAQAEKPEALLPQGRLLAFAEQAAFTSPEEVAPEKTNLPLLLLIEDNQDVVQYLISCLDGQYQLVTAPDGQTGIDKAFELVPDIVISDVMMPEKDGFEVCRTLKTDRRTSHIPIILLTAKADIASKLEGLEHGADAYLAKPFNEKELNIRLKKLIELRIELQQNFHGLYWLQGRSQNTTRPMEDEFLHKFRSLVEENLSDPKYGIVQICRAMQLSRSQLFRKLKALTGKSTSLLVRSIRLQKAKTLLLTTDLNVSEIAYEVGFTSPAYFTRSFVEEFGEPPSELKG